MSITNIGLLGIKSCVMIQLSKKWKPKINWTYLTQANCKKVSKVALFDKWAILDSFLTFALAREVQLNFGFQFLLSWIIAKLLIVNNPFFETNNFFTSEGASKIFKGLALRILEPKIPKKIFSYLCMTLAAVYKRAKNQSTFLIYGTPYWKAYTISEKMYISEFWIWSLGAGK